MDCNAPPGYDNPVQMKSSGMMWKINLKLARRLVEMSKKNNRLSVISAVTAGAGAAAGIG